MGLLMRLPPMLTQAMMMAMCVLLLLWHRLDVEGLLLMWHTAVAGLVAVGLLLMRHRLSVGLLLMRHTAVVGLVVREELLLMRHRLQQLKHAGA